MIPVAFPSSMTIPERMRRGKRGAVHGPNHPVVKVTERPRGGRNDDGDMIVVVVVVVVVVMMTPLS